MSLDETPRYPKRKRAPVNYHFDDDSEAFVSDSEAEEDRMQKRARVVKKPRQLPKSKIFPFLDLPAEIRNRIYAECLIGSPYYDNKEDDCFVIANKSQPSIPDSEPKTVANTALYLRAKQKSYRRTVELYNCQDESEPYWASSACCKFHERQRRQQQGLPYYPIKEESAATRARLIPQILAVNKQIHAEAASVLYGQVFVFADVVALVNFLTCIGSSTAQKLRHVQINDWIQGRARKNMAFLAGTLMAAKGLTQLETFRIDCEIGRFHSWSNKRNVHYGQRVARRLFRDMYPWLSAVGYERNDQFAGLRLVELSIDNFGKLFGQWSQTSQDEAVKAFRKELRRLVAMP